MSLPLIPDAGGGDFKLFEKIDIQGNGTVLQEEFLTYLKNEHQRRGDIKGGRYINTFLHTLARKLESHLERTATAARTAGDVDEAKRLEVMQRIAPLHPALTLCPLTRSEAIERELEIEIEDDEMAACVQR